MPACRARAETPHAFAAIVQKGAGRQVLSIAYPWTIHPQASIEVRLTKRDSTAIVTPICFLAEQFKDDTRSKVYNCLEAAEQRESTDSFVKDNVTYRIIARRNSLGRPAALVIPEEKGEAKGDGKHASEPGPPRAVFLLLDSWAINDHLLNFDLPRDTFSQPGLLHVWFMRGGQAMWRKPFPGREQSDATDEEWRTRRKRRETKVLEGPTTDGTRMMLISLICVSSVSIRGFASSCPPWRGEFAYSRQGEGVSVASVRVARFPAPSARSAWSGGPPRTRVFRRPWRPWAASR